MLCAIPRKYNLLMDLFHMLVPEPAGVDLYEHISTWCLWMSDVEVMLVEQTNFELSNL